MVSDWNIYTNSDFRAVLVRVATSAMREVTALLRIAAMRVGAWIALSGNSTLPIGIPIASGVRIAHRSAAVVATAAICVSALISPASVGAVNVTASIAADLDKDVDPSILAARHRIRSA